jgi:hypothetical protein
VFEKVLLLSASPRGSRDEVTVVLKLYYKHFREFNLISNGIPCDYK